MILNYQKFLNEALLPSQFRKYVKEFNRDRYKDIFEKYKEMYEGDKNAYRIYIPLLGGKNPIKNELEAFLKQNGYVDVDYVAGTCRFEGAKNISKIGRILTKFNENGLMKKFVEDPKRKAGDELLVCISRHPYDIAGSDTDRNWTNCMTLSSPENTPRMKILYNQMDELALKTKDLKKELKEMDKLPKKDRESDENREKYKNINQKINNFQTEIYRLNNDIANRRNNGGNTRFIINDVKEGSIISYLIKNNDKDLKNPVAVLNIKPYISDKDPKDFVLVADNRPYGIGTPEFIKTVNMWLDTVNKEKSGTYKLHPGLYNDGKNIVRILNETDYEKMKKSIITSVKKNRRLTTIMSNRIRNLRAGDKEIIIEEVLKINTECAILIAIAHHINLNNIPLEKIIECCEKTPLQHIVGYILNFNVIKAIGLKKEDILNIFKSNPVSYSSLYQLLSNKIISLEDILSVVNFEELNSNIKYNLIITSINLFDTNKEGLKILYDKNLVYNKVCKCGCGRYVVDYPNTSYNISLNNTDVENLKSIGIEFPERGTIKSSFTEDMVNMAKKYKYEEVILPYLQKNIKNSGLNNTTTFKFMEVMNDLIKNKEVEVSNSNLMSYISNGVYNLVYSSGPYSYYGATVSGMRSDEIFKLASAWQGEIYNYNSKMRSHFH